MDLLPAELQLRIAQHVCGWDLGNLVCVNKRWRQICKPIIAKKVCAIENGNRESFADSLDIVALHLLKLAKANDQESFQIFLHKSLAAYDHCYPDESNNLKPLQPVLLWLACDDNTAVEHFLRLLDMATLAQRWLGVSDRDGTNCQACEWSYVPAVYDISVILAFATSRRLFECALSHRVQPLLDHSLPHQPRRILERALRQALLGDRLDNAEWIASAADGLFTSDANIIVKNTVLGVYKDGHALTSRMYAFAAKRGLGFWRSMRWGPWNEPLNIFQRAVTTGDINILRTFLECARLCFPDQKSANEHIDASLLDQARALARKHGEWSVVWLLVHEICELLHTSP